MNEGRILIVDDEPEMCGLVEADLSMRGFRCRTSTCAEQALELLRQDDFDAVLTDLVMPGLSGVDLCDRIQASNPEVPVVVMTAFGSMDAVIEVLRASAFDFITKPFELEFLALVVQRAIDHGRLAARVRLLSHPVDTSDGFPDLIGRGRSMQEVKQQILQVAPTQASVLLTGESGTGKELVARAICRASKRKERPFVAVNCAALPAQLMESELFGHAQGAFTGARTARTGLFQEAHGGTLFLDEVGALPLELQPKLLRVLEDRNVRPVGSNRETAVDVRIIAATNRELPEAVAAKTFREDLYYRLQVVEIALPPLRERGADILDLARHYIAYYGERFDKQVTGLTEKAAARLLDHRWPGNVRELRNAMERAVVLTRHEKIAVRDLPESLRSRARSGLRSDREHGRLATLEEIERNYVLEVLSLVGDKKSEAARILGLDRKTLYRKLKRFEEASRERYSR